MKEMSKNKYKIKIRKDLINALNSAKYNQIFKDKYNNERIADLFLDKVVQIIPRDKMIYRTISLSSFSSGGKTIKLSNIRLNIKDFLEAIGSAAITATGISAFPWIAPIAFLILINQILKNATVEIGEAEGKVLWAILSIYVKSYKINLKNIAKTIRIASKERNIKPLTREDIKASIKNLESLKCIKKDDKDTWKIIERVNILIKY